MKFTLAFQSFLCGVNLVTTLVNIKNDSIGMALFTGLIFVLTACATYVTYGEMK